MFEIFQNLGYFLIGSGVLAFLIKKLFKLFLDKDLQKYKNDLEKESFRFNQLHQKRADVIEKLYHKLTDFEQQMISLTKPMQWAGEESQDEKAKKAQALAKEFYDYLFKNKIYFSDEICKLLEEIKKIFNQVWVDFMTFPVYKNSEYIGGKDRLEKWNDSWKNIKEEIPKLKVKLEEEFRNLLGVN